MGPNPGMFGARTNLEPQHPSSTSSANASSPRLPFKIRTLGRPSNQVCILVRLLMPTPPRAILIITNMCQSLYKSTTSYLSRWRWWDFTFESVRVHACVAIVLPRYYYIYIFIHTVYTETHRVTRTETCVLLNGSAYGNRTSLALAPLATSSLTPW